MTKLTRYTVNNPIEQIERVFDGFFNLTPVFHNLEDVYRHGDLVHFSSGDDGLDVQIDLPGTKKGDLDLSTDIDTRDVYVKATRTVKTNDGEQTQSTNRSFSVGREFDLKKIKFTYEDGVLEVFVPRRKKEDYIKKYTV